MTRHKSVLCRHEYHGACQHGEATYRKCDCDCHSEVKPLSMREELLQFGYELWETVVSATMVMDMTEKIMHRASVGEDAELIVFAALWSASKKSYWSMDEFLRELSDGGLDFNPQDVLRYKD